MKYKSKKNSFNHIVELDESSAATSYFLSEVVVVVVVVVVSVDRLQKLPVSVSFYISFIYNHRLLACLAGKLSPAVHFFHQHFISTNPANSLA